MSKKNDYQGKHKRPKWLVDTGDPITDLVHNCAAEGHRWVNNDSDKSRCCLGCGMVEYR